MRHTMTDISELDTPAVLIDVKKVEANLTRAQAYADRQGMKLRPHIKTHKLPFFARRQLELGAIGITCQKLGEAEVMAEAGITDILIPYNLIGPQKLRRLRALRDQIDVSVTADNRPTVDGYSSAFADAPAPLPVLVECDTGGRRCGVQTAQEAVTLAQYIASRPGLRFGGLMTYPPRGSVPVASRRTTRV